MRAAFLSECGWGSRRAILAALERRDQQFIQALRDRLHVVLWFEHDLYDQLQVLDALALAQEVGGAPELIIVDSSPGKPSFHGLGELTAEEMETLWTSRRAATPAIMNAATAAWDRSGRPADGTRGVGTGGGLGAVAASTCPPATPGGVPRCA